MLCSFPYFPTAEAQLDHKCESFLSRQFGLHIDFTAEHALPTLAQWGLVQQDEAGLFNVGCVGYKNGGGQ